MRRISKDKIPQVEQLIAYTKLMGLNGADLMSIGGKMKRDETRAKVKANVEIIESMKVLPIGRDRVDKSSYRFKLKTANGAYNFHREGYDTWYVVSLQTKIGRRHSVEPYDYALPRWDYAAKSQSAMLLDIASGKFWLNF